MNSEIGSIWNKWDLHVHTPCSIEQHYGGDTDEVWEKFICDLENLPFEFKVLGINDYLFIDGYERVLDYKQQGRLKNIDLIFPVIELRLDTFGGTEGHWSRLNFHVIFADNEKISADLIRAQFISSLSRGYKLSPDYIDKLDWKAVPTKESLMDLGQQIINSVPERKKKDYKTPLEEGFNNINYNYDDLISKLKGNTYLEGRYFTAIGKTEWESIRWNTNSIAEKKSVINRSDFVFTSSENPETLLKAKGKLISQGVKSTLLDCSDAHLFSDSDQKDRIGKCFTWIKADTSFEGLRQIIYEPERIYLGEVPEKIPYVDHNKTKFIKSIEIRKKAGSNLDEKWFDSSIIFNKDLIAIIGNKGSGKSALLDIIGLLGNSRIKRKHFPFLNQEQFLREGKASNFTANLLWESGDKSGFIDIDSEVDRSKEEMIRYIPQNYFEEICNQLTQTSEESEFYKELSKVIFSHVNVSERLGRENIDQLINHHREEIDDAISQSKLKLDSINKKLIDIEEKMKPGFRKALENKISTKKKELDALTEPLEVKKPAQDDPKIKQIANEIEVLKKDLSVKEVEQEGLIEDQKALNIKQVDLEKLKRRVENFENAYKELIKDLDPEKKELMDRAVNLSINLEVFNESIGIIVQEISKKEQDINNLIENITKIKGQIKEKQNELDKPNREYQDYLNKHEIWNSRKKEIIGNEKTPDTLKFFESQLNELNSIENKLDNLQKERIGICEDIFHKKTEIAGIYSRLYSPVQEFIETQELGDEFRLKFSVSVEIENFHKLFFDYISHGFAGSFYRIEDGESRLTDIVNSYNFNSFEKVSGFLEQIIDNLSFDRREGRGNPVNLEDQLLTDKGKLGFYNFLYGLEYLTPRFVLKLGDKDIQLLSPGEKGTLLLVFYLLIDKDKMPLLIDQPEHNLDNQTVYKLLVECVKKAKHNRQIFIVTHNPNLAVVCDAEQVICTRIDKIINNEVHYAIGAIENPKINKKIVDILEGTKPAFNQRRFKYLLDAYDNIP